MKSVVAAVVCAVLGAQVSWAQTPAECKPSSLNIPEAKYPCVYPDHRATFRVIAPNAEKVRVRVGSGFDMQKGPDGIWDVTTTPLVEGFHYYTLQIDGAVVADPSTFTFFGSGWWNSGIEIPASDADFYAAKDVPHGRVSQQHYYSTVTRPVAPRLRLHAARLRQQGPQQLSGALPAARLGRRRDRLVPAGTRRAHHGQPDRGGQSQADDHRHGQPERRQSRARARRSSRARGLVPPPSDAPPPPPPARGTPPPPAPGGRGGGPGAAGRGPGGPLGRPTYTEMMFTDLVPLVERTYRVRPGKENRAMAGLSMGGAQTFATDARRTSTSSPTSAASAAIAAGSGAATMRRT